ncbi:flagellar biosynthesis regulator FlaF [Pseudoroseomonas globiformis]|uniref:Flagellar biosynthesis regulator FlaF n=1 Tax=Teichococcus globiformis TaxID=2307229 RepID=A0ABV7G2R2_9PROT
MLQNAYETLPNPVRRPLGAAAAYGAVIRGTEDPREIEYRVLARATALLDQAAQVDAGPTALSAAIHENRLVWIAFTADLAGENNSFDNALKARLVSLARWVFTESERVLRARQGVQPLIDVNRAVMAGLQPGITPATEMS